MALQSSFHAEVLLDFTSETLQAWSPRQIAQDHQHSILLFTLTLVRSRPEGSYGPYPIYQMPMTATIEDCGNIYVVSLQLDRSKWFARPNIEVSSSPAPRSIKVTFWARNYPIESRDLCFAGPTKVSYLKHAKHGTQKPS